MKHYLRLLQLTGVMTLLVVQAVGCVTAAPEGESFRKVNYGFRAAIDDRPMPELEGISAESCSNGYGGFDFAFAGTDDRIKNAIDDELYIRLNIRVYELDGDSMFPLDRPVEVANTNNIRLFGTVSGFLPPDAQKPLTVANGTIMISELSRYEISGSASIKFTDPDDVHVVVQEAVTLDAAFTNLAIQRYCTDPWVFFSRPQDQAMVTSPVSVGVWAQNIIVEPAGQVRSGHGHLHIIVDNGCVLGEGPHQDYDQGEFQQFQLELTPGPHHLCLQAADGAHEALDVMQEISISVE